MHSLFLFFGQSLTSLCPFIGWLHIAHCGVDLAAFPDACSSEIFFNGKKSENYSKQSSHFTTITANYYKIAMGTWSFKSYDFFIELLPKIALSLRLQNLESHIILKVRRNCIYSTH